jgi:hypothetical protein
MLRSDRLTPAELADKVLARSQGDSQDAAPLSSDGSNRFR